MANPSCKRKRPRGLTYNAHLYDEDEMPSIRRATGEAFSPSSRYNKTKQGNLTETQDNLSVHESSDGSQSLYSATDSGSGCESEMDAPAVGQSVQHDVFSAVVSFMEASRKHQMSREQQRAMLRFLAQRCSVDGFPTSLYFLDKYVTPYLLKPVKHCFCKTHQNYIASTENPGRKCPTNGCESNATTANVSTGTFFVFPVESTVRSFFESADAADLSTHRRKKNPHCLDLYDGEAYKSSNLGAAHISLTFHIDDGETFGIGGSNKGSVCILSFIINELPPRKRYRRRFVYSISVGQTKPEKRIVLNLFATEIARLEIRGTEVRTQAGRKIVKVTANILTADSQARWDALGHGSFAGECGCTICLHPGKVVTGTRVYPSTVQYDLRTRKSTLEYAERALRHLPSFGVKNVPVLLQIQRFGAGLAAPPDILHAVGQGHVVKSIWYWTGVAASNFPFFSANAASQQKIITARMKTLVDQKLKRVMFPSQFQRTIPPFSCAGKNHGIENVNLLLYGAFFALDGILPHKLYANLMNLVMAVHLLLMDNSLVHGSLENHVDLSRRLLIDYYDEFERIYGKREMLYNCHQILHLPQAVQQWGPAYHFSTFCFEDFLGSIMRSTHGTTDLATQMVRNYQHKEFLYRFGQVKQRTKDHSDRLSYSPKGRPVAISCLAESARIAFDSFAADMVPVVRFVFYTRAERSDCLCLDAVTYTRKTVRKNHYFYTTGNEVVKLLLLAATDDAAKMYAVVETVRTEAFRALRLPDGSSPEFIRKLLPAPGKFLVRDANDLFRPLVSVTDLHLTDRFFILVPQSHYVL